MKIAVMQPYIFPYIGYFQLVRAVDKFIFYDDVNFIKQGWINRNRILSNGEDLLFTIPLDNASSFKLINETLINDKLFPKWKQKFIRTIEQNYKKAPYYNEVSALVFDIFRLETNSISEIAINSVVRVSAYLQLNTEFAISSKEYNNSSLDREARLIDLCQIENASHYINPIGGKGLYTKDVFAENGIELSFINSLYIKYNQFNEDFVPWLSIIDVLMFNSIDEVKAMLDNFELI